MKYLVAALSILLLLAVSEFDRTEAQCQGQQTAKLTASDPFAQDEFGHDVAISGDVAVIGVRYDDDGAYQGGAVYVFRFDGSTWVQEDELFASDAGDGDEFGISVDIDADTVVVGANFDDDGGRDSGSAYVFLHDGSGWNQVAKLTASDAVEYDNFGYSVAIRRDVVIVGANLVDGGGANSGAAYVFHKPAGGWTDMTETFKLVAADDDYNDEFGKSVAIDGDVAVIGAQFDQPDGSTMIGSAYIFEYDGAAWSQSAKLTSSDGEYQDRFGLSSSISGDLVVVGAWADDDAGGNSGSAYLFRKPAAGWADMTQTAKLTASDAAAGDHFGWDVDNEGDLVAVGAPAHNFDGSGYGSVYLFEKPATGWADSTETASYSASDHVEKDEYGYAVSISGNRLLASSRRHETAGYDNSGAAYIHGGLADCQPNETIDICDIATGSSKDDNGNGVPDECEGQAGGSGSIERSLVVGKAGGGQVELSWAASCIGTDTDYVIYEGLLLDWNSHAAKFCTTGGELQISFQPDELDSYYLVTPRSATNEGTIGKDSYGVERSDGVSTCLNRFVSECP